MSEDQKIRHLKLVPKCNVIPFKKVAAKPETPIKSLKDDLRTLDRLHDRLRLITSELEELTKE